MDATHHEIVQHYIFIAVQLRHKKFSGWVKPGDGMKNGRQYCRLPYQHFYFLNKGNILDFDKVGQSCLAADFTGEPVPFTVADFQAVMFTGTIGAAANTDKLVGFCLVPLLVNVRHRDLGFQQRLDLGIRQLDHRHFPSRCPPGWCTRRHDSEFCWGWAGPAVISDTVPVQHSFADTAWLAVLCLSLVFFSFEDSNSQKIFD